MAADGSVSASDSQELSRRINELNAKLDAAVAANATSKNVLRVVGIAVAVSAIAGVYMILSPFVEAYKDRDKYQKVIMKELQESVLPELQAEGKLLIDKSVPKLQEVAIAKWQEREEQVLAAGYAEVEAFLETMQNFAENEIKTRRERVETVVTEKLKDAVPELRNEAEAEVILTNAAASINNAVEQIMVEQLGTHIKHVNNIANNLAVFPVPERYKAMDDLALREELTNALGAYATKAFRNFLNPETKEYLRTISEDTNTGGAK
jgi:hypothetical protein